MSGLKRNIEGKINKLLDLFPVVIILGVRQCGKTFLARKLKPNWHYFDLEKSSDYDFITRDYDFFFKEYNRQVIIDEIQTAPEIFSELRGIIDQKKGLKNRFILTGSSSFALIKDGSESLAGRAALVELGTLKMNERYQKPFPLFYQIFSNPISEDSINHLLKLTPKIDHDQVMTTFLTGGYPDPVLSIDPDFFFLWMENYFQAYIQRDIRSIFPRLDILKFRRFISILSSLSGTVINRSHLGRTIDTSEVTVKEYLDIAHHSYWWRNLPSYKKSISKSMIKMPKGHMRDSGLVNFIQRIRSRHELNQHPMMGSFFESFITEEIIKGLNATLHTNWDYYYYRTKNGAEVDLILEGDFGVLPIEIKSGFKTNSKSLRSLSRFIKDHSLPFGIIINNSDQIKMLADKIIQIPASFI